MSPKIFKENGACKLTPEKSNKLFAKYSEANPDVGVGVTSFICFSNCFQLEESFGNNC